MWQAVQDRLDLLSAYAPEEILALFCLWLEGQRFSSPDKSIVDRLANVYSFFIELYNSQSKISELSSEMMLPSLLYLNQEKLTAAGNCGVAVDTYLQFETGVLHPYYFDDTFGPASSGRLAYLDGGEALNRWKTNENRYTAVEELYALAAEIMLENSMDVEAPEVEVLQLRNRLFFGDSCIDDLWVNEFKVPVSEGLATIQGYSLRLQQVYDRPLMELCAEGYNVLAAVHKLLPISALTMPFLLDEPQELSSRMRGAVPVLTADNARNIVQIFTFTPSEKSYSFNRHHRRYQVTHRPYYKFGTTLFCPTLFMANNGWFYSGLDVGIRGYDRHAGDRKDTAEKMETLLADTFEGHSNFDVVFSPKRPCNKGGKSDQPDGDVDVLVTDGKCDLLIQLKRTAVRFNLREAYSETINSDGKAIEQLREAEQWLQANPKHHTLKKIKTRWVVSTSSENIGALAPGIRKVNYYELLLSLRFKQFNSLEDLTAFVERDGLYEMLEIKI